MRRLVVASAVAAGTATWIALAGTNDLLRGAPARAVVDDYRRLLAAIPPSLDVHVLSVPPMRHGTQRRIPAPSRIDAVNRELRRLAPAFTDLRPSLAAADGRLEAGLTPDGIHLNAAGYAAIADLVPRP